MADSVPDDAFDLITEPELIQLSALVQRAGPDIAWPLLHELADVDGPAELNRVTRRQWATLRIALTVAAQR